jgi:hypothetical protein
MARPKKIETLEKDLKKEQGKENPDLEVIQKLEKEIARRNIKIESKDDKLSENKLPKPTSQKIKTTEEKPDFPQLAEEKLPKPLKTQPSQNTIIPETLKEDEGVKALVRVIDSTGVIREVDEIFNEPKQAVREQMIERKLAKKI